MDNEEFKETAPQVYFLSNALKKFSERLISD